MAVQELRRDSELCADLANLILVEGRQRFHQAPGIDQALNPGHPVVMRLDQIGLGGAARFYGVGVNGPLPQHPSALRELPRI